MKEIEKQYNFIISVLVRELPKANDLNDMQEIANAIIMLRQGQKASIEEWKHLNQDQGSQVVTSSN